MNNSVSQTLKQSVATLAVAAAFIPTAAFSQSLEQAVATALDNNPEIRQAFNRFKAREEQVNQASAGYFPTVDFNAGIGREWTDSPSTRRDGLVPGVDDEQELTRREIGVSLRQMIFDGFLTSSEVNRTEREASAEQWALFATAEDTALEVSRSYLEFLRSEQIVGLAQRNLDSHQTIYDAVKEKTDSGLGSVADFSQVTGRLARAHSNLISAQNNLSDTKIRYKRLVGGYPVDSRLPVPDSVMLPGSLEQALEQATGNHPTLRSAGNDIEAANAQRESAQSSYLPKVSFDLSAGWDHNVDGVDGVRPTDVGGENNEILAMVRLSYNLYSGGADSARDREAAYNINEARELHQTAYLDIVEGTTLAWNAREFLHQQMQYLQQHVEAATETRNSYSDQFRLGQRTLLDVLDSENELFQARRDYLTAEYDDLIAQYRLFNATGVLLDSLRVTTPKAWLGEDDYEGGVKL